MAHKLKLFIEDLFQDPKYIRIGDESVYDKLLGMTNRVLKIDVPGQQTFTIVRLPVNGSFTYTSKSLKISRVVEDLPDGLWAVTLSVCPNEKAFTTVYHFRTVALEVSIFSIMGKILGGSVQSDVNAILIDCLLKIKALKTNAIDNYNVQKAYDLYSEIQSIINKLEIR